MDEHFGALDAITRQTLQDELLRIWGETGKSILFVTHDIDEAVYLGDRVLLLGGTPARVVRTYDVEAARPRSRDGEEVGRIGTQVKADLSSLFDEGGGI
jgi:NitT/TauT family transport system ATP-binding protein